LIHNRWGAPVVPVDFSDLIELPAQDGTEPGEALPPCMAAAVGQALNRGDRPNLLANERKVEKALRRFKALGSLLTPAAAVVVLMLYWMTAGHVTKLDGELNAKRAMAGGLQQHVGKIAQVNRLEQELAKREKAIRDASGRPIDYAGILKELSLVVPDNVTLAGLSIDPVRRDGTVRLDGLVHAPRERGNAVVGQFIKRLEASPYFANVSPVSYDGGGAGDKQDDGEGAAKPARFQVRCRLIR